MTSRGTKVSRPRLIGRLRTGVWITLAVKFVVLVALYLFLFSPSQRPHVDERAVAQHFLATG
ncbi:MAG: cytochrome oxidase putative small subunit CydP [Rhodanobacteraceae bacterium]